MTALIPESVGRRLSAVPIGLWVVLLVGIELRVALWLVYQPATMSSWDTNVYVAMADGQLFGDPTRPAGYSILLSWLHAISADIDLTIAVQHLIGIATAFVMFGALRRLGTPSWVAIVGAAGILLSLDQIFLEHALLTEAPFTFVIAVMLYASVRALEPARPLRGRVTSRHLWIVAAGVALGLSVWLRAVMVPAIPLIALWFAVALRGSWGERLGRAALAGGAAAAMILGYAALQSAHNGYFGLSPSTGWALYARTAQFADCSRFDPPGGTQRLCEEIPAADRPGPDYYAWQPGSPARRLYGNPPHGNSELTSFARAAVVGQPLDYLGAVATDSLRYFGIELERRPWGDVGFEVLDIDYRTPEVQELISLGVNTYYRDEPLEIAGAAGALADIQSVVRLQSFTMGLAIALAFAGIWLASGALRAGLALFVLTSLVMMFVPPATAIWSARYGVPAGAPLVGAAAAGAWLAVSRIRAARLRPSPPQSPG